ncbi:MAG: 2-nitropropane dioxygenase, partial [Anaerolineae bacterium]|nr:2-nitropropane dioxygenase [Anaerolineae bacterium]
MIDFDNRAGSHLGAPGLGWQGPSASIAYEPDDVLACLRRLDGPLFVVQNGHSVGVTNAGELAPADKGGLSVVATGHGVTRRSLGDPAFLATYGLEAAYMGGSMANGISSEELVIALGGAGMLG